MAFIGRAVSSIFLGKSKPEEDEIAPAAPVAQANGEQEGIMDTMEEEIVGEMEEKYEDDLDTDDSFDMEETLKTFDTLEAEVIYLKRQNDKLRNRLKRQKSMRDVTEPLDKLTPYELSRRVQERLPEFVKKADKLAHPNVIFIPSEIEGEVGLIDKSTIDWWSVVDLENDEGSDLNTQTSDEMVFSDASAIGGPYVYVRPSDVVDAVAYFVAQCVVRIPECSNLTEQELLKMLDGTFDELREKGPLGKMWQWGQFLYSTYGWTSYAWTIYENPIIAETVATCLWTAAVWMLAL